MRDKKNWIRKGLAAIPLSALILTPVPMLAPARSLVAQTNTHSQIVYLPDPTPRPKEPDLIYGNNQDKQSRVDSKAVQNLNAKRRELVVWAANQLVTLSTRMEAEVQQPATAESMASAKANADRIVKLSRSLSDAVKAQ